MFSEEFEAAVKLETKAREYESACTYADNLEDTYGHVVVNRFPSPDAETCKYYKSRMETAFADRAKASFALSAAKAETHRLYELLTYSRDSTKFGVYKCNKTVWSFVQLFDTEKEATEAAHNLNVCEDRGGSDIVYFATNRLTDLQT